MTYRIEITAETLSELAGKTLALAAQFQATAADPVMPEVKQAATRKPKAKAEEPKGNETDAPAAAGTGSTTNEDAAKASEETPTVASPASNEAPEAPEAEIDVVRDVQPLVLAAVAKLGKPAAAAIVQKYGAERVTQVAAEKLPALMAELKAVLA